MRLGEFSTERGACGGGGSGGDRGRAEVQVDSGGIEQVHEPCDPLGESDESEARMARLLRTIEGEIVPRLVLARRAAQATAAAEPAARQDAR